MKRSTSINSLVHFTSLSQCKTIISNSFAVTFVTTTPNVGRTRIEVVQLERNGLNGTH